LFIHRLTAALVHLVLLHLNAAQLFLELATFRHLALLSTALPRMDLEQRPYAPAYIATALNLGLALRAMRKEVLQLFAVCRWTRRTAAARGML